MTAHRRIAIFLTFFFLLMTSAASFAGNEYVTYLHVDVQGSPLVATDEQGAVAWREDYEPWGSREVKDTASASASRSSKVWYTGKEEESSLGMYYYGARWYMPDVGQFSGLDPATVSLNNTRSFSRYAYANNNPVRYVDPNGESPFDAAFLLYDVGQFGMAVYKGTGVGAAAVDVGLDLVGVISPIPGSGQILKATRTAEHVVEAGRAVEHATEAKRATEGVESAAKACCCFVAGTPVLTENGLRAIEAIKVGDRVPSKDTKSGLISLQKVSRVYITEGKQLYKLILRNGRGESETLLVTDNHPFFVIGKGWVNSSLLKQGQKIDGRDGGLYVFGLQKIGRSEATYNLTVEGNHNYFAGLNLALVHNCTCTIGSKVIKDGDLLPTSEALDAAQHHLGPGYKEVAPGVFKSADGNRVVRMTESDLAKEGNHAGAPHMNFENGKTVMKPNGKETFKSQNNVHVFLLEEK